MTARRAVAEGPTGPVAPGGPCAPRRVDRVERARSPALIVPFLMLRELTAPVRSSEDRTAALRICFEPDAVLRERQGGVARAAERDEQRERRDDVRIRESLACGVKKPHDLTPQSEGSLPALTAPAGDSTGAEQLIARPPSPTAAASSPGRRGIRAPCGCGHGTGSGRAHGSPRTGRGRSSVRSARSLAAERTSSTGRA